MGVGLVYLAARALGGASRAGILGFHALFISNPIMQALRSTATLAALAALMFLILFSSCKKDDSSNPKPADTKFDVQVDKTTAESGNPGYPDTIKFSVVTDLGWTLETDQPWLTPTSTTRSGSAVVKVAVAVYDAVPARTGNITVTTIGGAYTKTISITQKAAGLYMTQSTTDSIETGGGTMQVQVFAQGSWHLEPSYYFFTDPDPRDYVALSQSSGTGNATVTLTFAKNHRSARAGMLILSNDSGPNYSVDFAQKSAVRVGKLLHVSFANNFDYYSTANMMGYQAADAPANAASIDLTAVTMPGAFRRSLLSYFFRSDPSTGLTETVPANAAKCYFRKTPYSSSDVNFTTMHNQGYFVAKSMVDSIDVNEHDNQHALDLQEGDVYAFRNQAGKKGFIIVNNPYGPSVTIGIQE